LPGGERLGKRPLVAVDRKRETRIAVGGGCSINAVLMSALRRHLEVCGVAVLEARQASPNDGGLALGQGWVARRMGDGMILSQCNVADHR